MKKLLMVKVNVEVSPSATTAAKPMRQWVLKITEYAEKFIG